MLFIVYIYSGNGDVHKRSRGSSTVVNDGKPEKTVDIEVEQVTMGKHVGLPSGISLIVGTIIGNHSSIAQIYRQTATQTDR